MTKSTHLVALTAVLSLLLLLNLNFHTRSAITTPIEDDQGIKCLKHLKNSLSDPQSSLASWIFPTTYSLGFVCKFAGVSCWNDRENRVFALNLSSMSLRGPIPGSLRLCSSLQILNLSGNALSANIPSQLCSWLPYLVVLDLSRNNLTGPIPAEIANCKYLNKLILDDNRLSGLIPDEIFRLTRLNAISVANNSLSRSLVGAF
ncbi:hypothetical protein Sjap_023743 [Stephania japonica]|uniref:Leucine-rich repeat-containing N-terminal plant-type domain-containing protein n=1 Tax=Stephania japonica TaxID=461633 RepID=A0AAP0EC54_9MAGN